MTEPSYGPDARVVWVGEASGERVRVVLDGAEVLAQTLVVSFPPVWGAARPLLALPALSAAVAALAAALPAPVVSGVSPCLSAYLDLERKALAADETSEPVADAVRGIMDTVWSKHLSPNDRQWLNARGDVGGYARPVREGEDGNSTK